MANFIEFNSINFHLILSAILLIGIISTANGKQMQPLLRDDSPKINNRPAECLYGNTLHEIGSTWFADLGPPFGVMYCIRCKCVGIKKKNRIVGRLQCRNIKTECPEPTCDEPILLEGRCCKSCPGDLYSPDIVQDISPPVTNEEEERSMKHFAALLTGRTSNFLKREDMKSMYSTNNPQNIIATGRFSFHKKNLYYSFYISEKARRPRAIQFVDHVGNILEEHSLTIPLNGPFSVYQNSTGKICGVWRRVPRDYRRLLRDDQMNVVLLWGGKYQAELALAGQIGKYPALATELFSSLLEPASGTSPAQMSGAGGTAIVSTVSGVTSSVHVTLVLNGLFNNEDVTDVPLNIRLESVEKKQIILEDIQRVRKPAHDVNVIELSEPVSAYQLRLLTRGRLTITVESRKNPEALRIQGSVVTRVACEIFQTLLSSHNSEHHGKSSGLAWIYLNKDGSLVYNVQTENLNMLDNPLITLIDDSVKRKTELEDLTPSLSNNLAVGTLDRLSPRVLEPLYNGDLAINVATEHCVPTLIRGRLNWRPVADARDAPAPVLLKRLDSSAPLNMVGMAWMAVDNECNLHYEVTLTGVGNHYQQLQLYLEDIPIEAPGAPVTRKLLEDFTGNNLEGFALGLSAFELSKLETSVCFIEVHSRDKNEAFLKAKLKSIKVPNHCLPLYTDNDVPSLSHIPTEHNDNNLPAFESKCYHSGRFFDEGGQWSSGLEPCTMCSCVHSRVKCEPIKCPPLRCKAEDHEIIKGECCPSCKNAQYVPETNTTHPRGCRLGDQFYSAGASWHPYLPPNGFDTCAVCLCDQKELEIYCHRTQCPLLKCSEKMAYRPDKKACCKKCPEARYSNKTAFDIEAQRDQGNKGGNFLTTQDILANGGCNTSVSVHENGQEWHPIIVSLGEQKCTKCRCKDGHITCDRKRCPRSVCNNRITGRKKMNRQYQQQQQLHEQDECCQHKCERHHKKKRAREHQDHHQRIISTTTARSATSNS